MLTRLRTLRTTRWGLAAPLVFALAGLLATTSAQTARGTDLRSDPVNTADLIRAQQYRADVQDAQVSRLRSEVEQLTTAAAPAGSRLAALNHKAGALAVAAGTVPVTGRAIRVVLDDAPQNRPIPKGFGPADLVVHQQDLQAVVNALWDSGAEAMMLMDQRVISTSAVRCVGNVLILQDRVYSPPYRITAIGDPAAMQRALDRSAAVSIYRQYVDAVGLVYQVDRLGRTTIPGYDGSLRLSYAKAIS